MKQGKYFRKEKQTAGRRSLWNRMTAFLLTAAIMLGCLGQSAFGAGLGANIEFSAKIVKNTGDGAAEIASIESGDSFFLAVNYKFSSSPEGVSYNSASLNIQLPPYVSVDVSDPGTIITGEFKDPVVKDIELPGGSVVQQIQIPCQDKVDQGKAGVLYFKLSFQNMVTPNNTVANFTNMRFTGSLKQETTGETEKIDQKLNSVSISSIAAQDWNIQKTVTDPRPAGDGSVPVAVKNADGDYEVTYQIAVTDPIENMNRFGRLDCETFAVADTLPVADRENGGAQLVSVGYLDKSNTLQPLTEGDAGYTKELNGDGSLKSLSFHYFNTFDSSAVPEDQIKVPDGSLLPTTYQVTVKFDGEAYSIPTNLPFVRAILDNQAKLSFKPLAQDAVQKDSNAQVQVGDQEPKTTPVELIVEKQLTVKGDSLAVSGDSFVLDGGKQDRYGNAKFALYLDEACTQAAPDIDGNPGAGGERALNASGRVIFSNLRYGTYYLKETQTPAGFTPVGTDGVLKVEIDETGKAVIDGKTVNPGAAAVINNTTGENGVGYVAFWKQGVSASGPEAAYLPGVTFELVSQADASAVYTALSGADGLVLFEGIPAGGYTLRETAVPSGMGLEVSKDTWNVTVAGNQVNYPDGLSRDGKKPYIMNQSKQGVLELLKVDSANTDQKLSGAEFALYGPYGSEAAVPGAPDEAKKAAELVTGADGKATSDALATGWYLLVETKAPDGYAMIGDNDKKVQVEQNHTASYQIENAQRGSLEIVKYGKLTVGDVITQSRIPLAGAEFTVYTNEDCTDVAVDASGKPAVVVTKVNPVSGQPETPKITLNPGEYWLKETKTPSGYKPDDRAYALIINQGANTRQEIDNEVTEQGQIKITKTSGKSGVDLSGALFEIYEAGDAAMQRVVGTIETGSDGVGYSGFLPTGLYVLKEVRSIAGHIVPDSPFKGLDSSGVAVTEGSGISVTDNSLKEITVNNDPYVTIQLRKVDSVTSATLSGAEFALYKSRAGAESQDPKELVATSNASGANGIVAFDHLTPGTHYWYLELTAPTGYQLSAAPAEVVAPQAADNTNFAPKTVDVKNDRYGKLQVYKQGETLDSTGTMKPLQGAGFQYYPKLSDDAAADLTQAQSNKTVKTLTTGSNGYAASVELAPDFYWVQEVKAPGGYALDSNPQAVEVTAGAGITGGGYPPAAAATFTDRFDSGKIQIKKVSSIDGNVPLAASFKVQKQAEDGMSYIDYLVGGKPLVLTTNNKGEAVSGFLPAGTYRLVEQSVKGIGGDTNEYSVSAVPIPVIVEPGKTNKAHFDAPITNMPKRYLGIDKFEKWSQSGGEVQFRQIGVTFEIYDRNPAEAGANRVEAIVSGKQTVYTKNKLAPGDYWVKETVPEEYQVDSVRTDGAAPVKVTDNVYQVTLAADRDLVVAWVNKTDKSRIKIEKLDQLEESIRLDGAKFDLYQEVAPGTAGAEIINVNGTDKTLLKIQSGIESGTMFQPESDLHEQGSALTTLLAPGTYYFKETKAPNGYRISNEWTGPVTISDSDKGTIVGPQKIHNYKPVSVGGKKVDQDGNAVSGVWVALFASQGDADAARGRLLADQAYFSKLLVGGKLPEQVLKEHKILQASKSDGSGALSYLELQPNTVYYAVEIIGAGNFVQNTDVHPVYAKAGADGKFMLYNVGEGGALTNDLFRLANDAYGKIAVSKIMNLSGVDYPINGVKFSVYKADPDDPDHKTPLGEAVTVLETGTGGQTAGTALSGLLAPGWYVMRETFAPEQVDFDPDSAAYLPVYVSSGVRNDISGQTLRKSGGWTVNYTYYDTKIANAAAYGRVMLVKESSFAGEAGKKLTATFKVQVYDNGEYKDYPLGTAAPMTMTTNSSNYVVSELLPAGDYRLVEQSVETGYTVNAAPIRFTIEPNKITGAGNVQGGVYLPLTNHTTPSPIVILNDKQGGVSLTKKGDILGVKSNLDGVTFEVYPKTGDDPDADCVAEHLVTSAATKNGGRLSVSNLDAGDYWLKETDAGTNAANGFVPGMVVAVTVKAGETTTQFYASDDLTAPKTELLNVTTFGKLQIEKQDFAAPTVKLKGVKFGVYSDAAAETRVAEMETDANGAAVSGLLPAGDYYVKELTAPDGYFADTATVYGPYTVTENTVAASQNGQPNVITNVKKQTVEIIKQDSKSGSAIGGEAMKASKFELWSADKSTLLQTAENAETIQFTELQPNTTYYVKEATPPAGYALESGKDGWYEVVTGNTGTKSITIQNDPLGALKLEKVAKWDNPDPAHPLTLPLANVVFDLYRYDAGADGNLGAHVANGKTNAKGELAFNGLAPGDYMLKETVPKDFAEAVDGVTSWKVTVLKGDTNTDYTGADAIVNLPNKGSFRFTKFKGDGTTPMVVTSDSQLAEFKLYEGSAADDSRLVGAFSVEKDGTFASAALDAGIYTIVETKAPDGFRLDSRPITFEIKAKQITNLDDNPSTKVINEAKGTLQITKQADGQNGTVKLNTAKFQLYDKDKNPIGQPLTNVTGGVYQWKNLDPGTYYIKETEAPAGYTLDQNWYQATVAANQNEEKTYYPGNSGNMAGGVLTNQSETGRIRVYKQDEKNNPLKGARFEVYKVLGGDVEGEKIGDTITTGEDGYGYSSLLPAAAGGTRYLVKEIKAPDGYTLDSGYHPTVKVVAVLPVQEASEIAKLPDGKNNAAFTNKAKGDIVMFGTEIHKDITVDRAQKSLLEEPFSTSFSITGYAKGDNERDATRLVVTDQDIKMQYSAGGVYQTETPVRDDAYLITAVTVQKAYHKDADGNPDLSKPVKAVVQYQNIGSLGSTEEASWRDLPNGTIENAELIGASGQTLAIPTGLGAMAFRVVYTGVKAGFVADGIQFGVKFAQRPSDATLHEITRIQNTASFQYTFVEKDETGKDTAVKGGGVSNTVEATLPLIESIRVPVSLSIKPEGDQVTFSPDSDVTYVITAENKSQTESFLEPILSFDLPVGTTLNDFVSGNKQFVIMKMWDDGVTRQAVGTELTPAMLSFDQVKATKVVGGQLIQLDEMTTKVTMTFPNEALRPGERLVVRFSTHISPSGKADTLWCPAYLGSSYQIPQSVENAYGVSYAPVITGDGGSFQKDDALDQVLGTGGGDYVNNNAQITVGQNNSLSIYKQVQGEYDSRFKNYAELGHTAPGGSIDYNIRITNGSDDKVLTTRVVDILPFMGDTLTDRSDTTVINRATDLNRRPTLNVNGVKVLDAAGNEIDPSLVTVYYCTDSVNSWTASERTKIAAKDELPMIYAKAGNLWGSAGSGHTWSPNAPADMSKVTAIGIEVNQELVKGDAFEVRVSMTAPQYGTDEIDQYSGRFISNSAMCAVVRNSNATNEIPLADRPENQEVKVVLDLPKGAIGDYVFYDNNQNGIQDAGDTPVAGVKVTLRTTEYTKVNGEVQAYTGPPAYATTRADGSYLFEDLNCNVAAAGKENGDQEDPDNFVGGKLYQYQVEFEAPANPGGPDWVPTRRYAGSDKGLDSNIGADLKSELFTLSVSKDAGTGRLTGERNMTVDAGFVIPSALGDYVWLDENRDGVQGADEPGVNGVKVRLYTVENGKVSSTPLRETVTASKEGKDGYYLFDGLTQGQYVVEFDVTALKNELGLYRYGFTGPNQAAGDNAADTDSDAKHAVGGNDRVMRTDAVTLGYHQTDLTWDAGLLVYSALGGCAFDDRNYNEVRDESVPLTGTKVQLYRVVNGILEQNPIAEAMVDANGNYLFEYLTEGDYKVFFQYPEGYEGVLTDQGGDDTDSDVVLPDDLLSGNRNSGYTGVISLPANTVSLHHDGGARKYGAIGDYVWLDADKNGVQDPGETPVSNVKVYLFNYEGQSGILKQVDQEGVPKYVDTDENGRYLFERLKSGPDANLTYVVCFDLPYGSHQTIPYAGGDRALDSNVTDENREGFGYFTATIPLGYGQRDMTIDAGIIETSGSVGDYVWLDVNKNGVQDDGDMGLSGIRAVLEKNGGEDFTGQGGWITMGETVTNEKGYYRFDDLSEGIYRVRFLLTDPYTVTQWNQGGYRLDSDVSDDLGGGWFATAPFYLENGGFDMTRDCGVTLKAPGGNPFLPSGGTPGTGYATGDDRGRGVLVAMAAFSLSAGMFLLLRRKRKQR